MNFHCVFMVSGVRYWFRDMKHVQPITIGILKCVCVYRKNRCSV